MKKFKSAYVIGISFICIIAFFFGSVCYRVYRAKRYFDYGNTTSEGTSDSDQSSTSTPIDWETRYPFDENYLFVASEGFEDEQTESTEQETKSESKYLTAVNKFKDSIDYYTTKLLPGRMKYVEANALFSKTVGMKTVSGSDSVAVMKNGYLTFENNLSTDGLKQTESVVWFSDIMKEKGIDFLYVQYPTKVHEGDGMLPDGVVDNSNILADNLIYFLERDGVNCFDIRTELEKKDNDWYSNFFVTDHHWKPETGVWASGQIAKRLNSDFGYSLNTDIGDLKNYNTDVYKKYFLGAQGRIATLSYVDPEDISIIYPKGKTNMTVQYNEGEENTGSFEDVIFNREYLNNTDFYNYSAYSAYLNGNKALTKITNNDCKNGKKILIIGDSYNKCVAPYLAETFEQTVLLDRRYFGGSILNYIDKMQPDVVVIAYTPTIIGQTNGHLSTFNFD